MEIRTDAQGRRYRAGDALRVYRSVDNLPTGETIDKAWFTVKENLRDADADALVLLEITPIDGASGQVEDIGNGGGSYPVGTGRLRFDMTPTQTRTIGANRRHFGVRVLLSSGEPFTAELDVIELGPEIIAQDA